MPETIQAGYDIPGYVQAFLDSPKVQANPSVTKIKGFAGDIIQAEKPAMKARSTRVLNFSKTWDSAAFQANRHIAWAQDLWLLAQAVPDTWGLLVSEVATTLKSLYFG